MEWIEKILQAGNLTEACYEVIRNKGAAGVDKMSVKELKAFLDENRTQLEYLIRNDQYLHVMLMME
jgi:RNA-directed DNA polymerase